MCYVVVVLSVFVSLFDLACVAVCVCVCFLCSVFGGLCCCFCVVFVVCIVFLIVCGLCFV